MPLVIKTTGFEQYLDKTGGAYIRALILGTTGVGKTPSAAFWPQPIFANCEQGLMSIADLKIPYADITSSEDMDALLRMLRMECAKAPENRKYRTLVVDTFDAYQRKIIQQRLRAEHKEALSGWADWGWLDGKMSQFVEAITSLPMNVVVNLHTKDVSEGEGDDRTLVKAARLKGDIKDSIFQDFDLIGLMETYYQAEKGERVLKRHIRWEAEPKFPFLRDRSNKLPRFTDVDFTPSDYSRIFERIIEGVDDLPETQTLETLETAADNVPPSDTAGGPVTPDKLPAKKTAAAKKTTAKKAAEPKKAPAAQTQAQAEAAKPDEPVVSAKATEPGVVDADGHTHPGGQDACTPDCPVWGGKPVSAVTEPAPTPEPAPAESPAPTPDPAETERETATPVQDPAPAAPAAAAAPTAESIRAKVKAEQDAAVEVVEEKLGGEVVAEEETKPAANADPAMTCGFQPDTHKNFQQGHPGCGKDLSGENIAKVNLALLRAKAKLCSDCLDEWKKSQAA